MKRLALLLVLIGTVGILRATGGQSKLSISGPEKPVCIGSEFQLFAEGLNSMEYQWEPSEVFSNPTLKNPLVSIYKTTIFRVVRIDPQNGISDTAYYSVAVMEKPVEIIGNDYVCKGDSTYLKIENNFNHPYWSTGERERGIWVKTPGIYNVTAQEGCFRLYGETFVGSKTQPLAKIIASRDMDLCEGEQIKLTSFSDDNIEWSTRERSKSIIVKESGTVLLMNKNECGWDADEIKINVHAVEANFFPSHYECIAPLNLVLFNESDSRLEFNWKLNGETFSNEESPSIYLNENGEYQITLDVKNIYGCTDSKTIENIRVVSEEEYYATNDLVIFPNSFSPNGDGINDEFKVQSREITDFKLVVFDRWGNQVFSENGIDASWNGKNHNGELLPAGKYGIRYSYQTSAGHSVSKLSSIQLLR
ncbi:MAG: gliding motility-associated C-terminal domain-containing protein [Flavobacteriales bacterium]|nr:gliding motility-associated C-terminal domain-containing protein [Flavobacteriales bacterium]